MSETWNPASMWDQKPTKSRSHLLEWLVFLVVIAGVYFGVRELFNPKWAWRRAIHTADEQVKTDLWSRLQRETLIDGLDRPSTIEEVYAVLDDPDPLTRGWAVATIPSLKADPRVAIPRIILKLGDRETSVRVKATIALGESVQRNQPGRDEAIDGLTQALKDPEAEVRLAAVNAIGQIVYAGGHADDPLRSCRADDPALGLIADRLRDDDMAVRVEAAYVLACNDRGAEALPVLSRFIREQPLPAPLVYLPDRAFLVVMILAIHSQDAAGFLASELSVGREGYPERPRDALAWVARQGPEPKSIVRRLANQALRSEDPSLKHNAAILLHEIGYGPTIVHELIAAISDPSADIRGRAVDALGDLGDIDPAIIPALEAATKDPDRDVRERAFGAIQAIEWDSIEML